MIHFKIYNSAYQLPEHWDALNHKDLFLKTPFLKALENSSPSNITSYFIGVYNAEKLVGVAIIQRVEVYLEDMFRKTSDNIIKRLAKQCVSKIVRGNALVVGNLMHTGQHGLFFIKDEISQDDFLNCLSGALNQLKKEIKLNFNKKIRIIAFKDYFEEDPIHSSLNFFKELNLYKVQVQPNMMLSIPVDWESRQDYTGAFNKKYRRRYATAIKKGSDLICIELDLEQIENHSEEIYELYENVSDNARVNSFKLHRNHFYELKKNMKDNFKVFGYFLNEKLIGFYTLILNNDNLETYFLGYNQELQHKHQMYLNMLFKMAFFGIENNFKTVVYARTAMEIKSSIGAMPSPMFIYLKHTNNFIANTLLKFIVKYMNPIRQWEERHPFN